MSHSLNTSWRDTNGERNLGAKYSSAGVYFGDIHEDAWAKAVLFEGSIILVDGYLGCRARIEEV